jgi:hypothetical protein
MRRYRKSTGKESMRASRTRPNLSLIQMQNAGTAMGMMAASGVRQGSLVQRAQRQTSGQRPRFSSGQARNAGVAMGMMAASGRTQWSDDSFFRGASGESSPCNCKTTQTLSDGTVLTFFGKKLCGDRCCGQCKGAFELAPVQTGKRR